jgi:hypothetical protein
LRSQILFLTKAVLENGCPEPNSSHLIQNHSDIFNVIIAIKIGCQLLQEKTTNKVVNNVIVIFYLCSCGSTPKRKKKLLKISKITRSLIYPAFVRLAKKEYASNE